jgi:aspartyl-tRNA(Asn)/glutamyl-tRNA(Gln) amidotransferase subunit A
MPKDVLQAGQCAGRVAAAVERCLAAIASPAGEGPRTFTQVYPTRARAEAEAAERRRALGAALTFLDGCIVAVKDLFDVSGEPTWAGSAVLRDAPVAASDAAAVFRLRQAGAVIIGKTNMTEFAYSGVGLNPHFGTPANPYTRASVRRIPGGSSSGAAVAVADGMADLGLGTDTGGSVRIPAALCGLVGWKPTARRISRQGVWPLSPSLDSVGVIAKEVRTCIHADSVLTGTAPQGEQIAAQRLRLGRLRGYVENDIEPEVWKVYERALDRLQQAGVEVVDAEVSALERLPREQPGVVLLGYEAFQIHASLLVQFPNLYDPRVRSRLELGRAITTEQYVHAQAAREDLQQIAARELQRFDAWLLPTVARIAPPFSAFESDEDYLLINRMLLRNTSLINFLDGCAISLPCHAHGQAPVGLSIAALGARDAQVLAVARTLEAILVEGMRDDRGDKRRVHD